MAKVFTIAEGLENMGALKSGGQGSVYKARRRMEVVTAVKILPTPIHTETAEDKNFTAFENEVNKLKKVAQEPNPNVVKILSSGFTESGSFPFIEMEFIDGPDLEELLQPPNDPVFTVVESIKVAVQLSGALAHCHKLDVKHGDVKSNNIKFNIHTGNYVLLDFGLALMSDEQRRSSLRHAGAIEFMAPEQSEGQMLFETDVYSFGTILFELLAGVVPFPLKDKGETARNNVMIAHMETPPPDLLSLRREALPEHWSAEKKEQEMQLPEWLLTTINKCLQKSPTLRFANGNVLHQFIKNSSLQTIDNSTISAAQQNRLLEENKKLQKDNELLKQLLKEESRNKEKVFTSEPTRQESIQQSVRKKRLPGIVYLLLLAGLIFFIFSVVKSVNNNKEPKDKVAKQTPKLRRTIGQYKVTASRAHFHNEPRADTKRSGYMIPSNDVVNALDEENGFIYTEFTNDKGQNSKGWLRRQDLVPLEKFLSNPKVEKPEQRLTPEDINLQLNDARKLLQNNQVPEALYIYNYLAGQQVPEALYHCGNLGLQKKNDDVNCEQAFNMVKKASDKGFAPAKRTLGFLYIFADNKEVLQINDYEQCNYNRNVFRGTKLLMEAIVSGDSTAKKILDQLNAEKTKEPALQ